jgi:DNA-binding NarL/FixJ family response regulator
MEKKSLVLIDDHVIVRKGLKSLIERLGDYTISAEFDSADDFVDALPNLPKFDLILLDLSMPGMSGEELVEYLKRLKFECPILILTLNDDPDAVVKLFRNGVRGYLQKNCGPEILKKAIESILSDGYYHNEFLTLSLTSDGTKSTAKSSEQEILEQLTATEKRFLKLVCNDNEYTYDQIADQMKVSFRTIDGYRESIFDKFGIRSKTGLVLFVLRYNLLPLL